MNAPETFRVPGPSERSAGSNDRGIHAIVPAYRAQEYIGKCIKGLRDAGFRDDEIIVVDDCSPDQTAQTVRSLGIEPVALAENVGAAEARNAGAAVSNADILLFVDCDVVVQSDVRDRVAAFFASASSYSAVFGSYDNSPECRSPVSRFRNLLHRQVHVESRGDAVTFWTGCGAIRRESFEAVGGFDSEQRMMEDVRLGLKLHALGRKIRLDPAIQGKHLKRWTLSSMFRTDLFDRAIPWTRLLRTRIGRASSYALNLSLRGRISGIAVAGTLLGCAVAVIQPFVGLATVLGSFGLLIWANRSFLRELLRISGPAQAMLAVPLLWLHYCAACLGFAYARLKP
ncbi:glycosyltransferase family 2 protein [Erythrobacter sp.]|uniref:glycosyltransferase family 2 protein n=1 Tax=Erythrobacter sp. TaxID=1042 RepID=UPI003C714D08